MSSVSRGLLNKHTSYHPPFPNSRRLIDMTDWRNIDIHAFHRDAFNDIQTVVIEVVIEVEDKNKRHLAM